MTSYHPALRLSPSNSPYFKAPSPRSPTKNSKTEEPGLRLRRVNGTTTASSNAFDTLPSASKFVYTAGAAAVLATIDDDLNVTQTFFRANPNSTSAFRDGLGNFPPSPSPGEPRNRALGPLKEQGHNISPISSSGRDWLDSPGRTNSAKDRIKAATSVAISSNGKWLAIGETGYRPRILIFSAKEGSSETPVAVVAEHTFGVHALQFSPDSKSLASLGTVNDGFIYVWTIDERCGAATLSASNKCTSIVHSLCWMGRSVITAGLRFVKVWRPDEDTTGDTRTFETSRAGAVSTPRNKNEPRLSDFGNSILSPKHRALTGKNSLLGDLLELTFTCAVAISESKAIVCAETGEICLLDDSGKTQSLTLATNAGHRVTAARYDARQDVLHAVGADGHVASLSVSDLEKLAGSKKQRRQSNGSTTNVLASGPTVVASAAVGNAIVEVDSNRVIRLIKASSGQDSDTSNVFSRHLTAHQDAVLGVRPWVSSAISSAAFFTFSANGTVHFWDQGGTSVCEPLKIPVENSPEMYGLPNELKSVTSLLNGTMLASGDRYGSLTLVEVRTRRILHQVRAHSAEVLDLIAFDRDGVQYLASASRDRTVQLFICSSRLELSQTMDEHAGAVTGLLLSQDGEQLLSCSADRSIVVREGFFRASNDPSTLAFAMLRAIAVKSSPTSMCLTTQDDTVLISTVDRCIGKYSTKTGQPGFSFKCGDNEGGEAVAMSKILYAPSLNGNPTIACVSSSDKSLRLYSEYGSLIARDWGHTEGITDMAIISTTSVSRHLPSSPQIVTVAADSTIFMWDSTVSLVRTKESGSVDDGEAPNPIASIPLRPPLRKVISYSEMSRFRREKSMEERDPPSPSANISSTLTASPQKLRKKTSRTSLAQPPRLEPGFRSTFDPSRRKSMRHRSPSPPSPKASSKKDLQRKPSIGMSLKAKSTDNLLNNNTPPVPNGTGFGSLTASTESVCRTLRAYRKKLANSSSNDKIPPDSLRELEKELKLTARAVGEKSQGKNIDEAMMARLLDQASDKIVGLLDQKIKERVEDEVRRNGDSGSTSSQSYLDPPAELDEHIDQIERSDTAPGALETLRP